MKKTILLCLTVFLSTLSLVGVAQTGNTCGNPLVVTNVPFNDSGNTSTYGNDYSNPDVPPLDPNAITNGSSSYDYYISGDDVVYSYLAGANGSITISTTNDDDWVGLFVFSGCPFSSTLGYHTSISGTTRTIPNLPVILGQTYYIVISTWGSQVQNTNYTVNITGTQVANPPTCLQPSNLGVSNPTSTSVELGWTDNGTATMWDIEWGSKDFTPTGTPTVVGTTLNPHPLSGLTPQTEYDFYVRADCGLGDLSSWTGPYTFETTCATQLSGTYTIGATGDYTSLSAAVTALNTCGVSAPVTFNVLTGSGPYNEQLTINEFMGASATNTVTFNGNGETITASTVTGARSLFLLDGADYVTINDFNLVTIEDANNFVVQLINNADNNTISNNTIDMTSTMTSTGTTNAGIVIGGSLTSATAITDSGSDNSITGNTIIGGYYGINVNGQSATRSMNNVVSNNTLKDFYSYGISLRHNNNANVTNNEISRPDRVTVSTFYGIYFASGGEGNLASENNIHTPFGGLTTTSTTASYGIYHTANDAPVGNENTVINNIIHLSGNNGTVYGFYNTSSDGVHYFHNTVVLDDANSTDGITRGFYQTTTADNIELKNNIFSILRTGSGAKYCLYFNTSTSTIVSDHNVLYMGATDGTIGIGYSGSAQTTLSDWQTATSGDANSVDVDPLFANRLSSDFMPTNSAVNNIGTPVGVATDYSGNPRNATTPDPGVYEFTPPSCPQPNALSANNILATSADLSWTENGTATDWNIEWGPKGFIPTEIPNIPNATNPQNLGGLTALTEYDFYVRANCGPGDESIWVGPYTFKTDCPGPLAGSYTVGATGDFTTLSDVAYALNTCGISATTTFSVLPGSGPYEEQITLGEIVGASATNTIAINGNGETLTAVTVSASRSLILLDGTDYTTIVNFNLVTQSPTNNFVIQLTNNADHNVITNNTIDMASTIDETGTANAGILVSGSLTSATSTTGNSGTDNVIVGNTIVGGYYGISICGQSSTRSFNNIISNNTVKDFYSFGISLRYANDNVVANNDISRPDRNTVTTFNGIYYASGGEGNITAMNTIHTPFGGISGATTTANYGIYHTANDAPIGNESKVINNLIHLSGNNGTAYGLYNSNSDGIQYYHNTVVLNDANSTSGTTRGFYQTGSASGIELKNNVFSISRAGSGAKYCLYFATASSNILSDHNVLHMGSNDGTTGIGYSGSAQTTLADWQTASGGDANSVDANPLFANPLSSDFTPTNPAVNNIGTPVGVTTDINGSPRDAATPDPGAYEFIPPSCPQPSAIQVPNVTITTADLIWQENGSAIQWEVEYGIEGFAQGSGTVVTDNDGVPGMTLSPLTGNTPYDVYVRAICAVGDESTWSGPFSFTTACGVIMAPYLMDFETSQANTPNCWAISSSVATGWAFDTSPSSSNNYGDHTTGSGYFAYVDASGSATTVTPDATLISPLIDVSGLTAPKLEFYKYHYDADNSASSISNILTVEVHDGTAWNVVHFDDNGDVNAWEKVEIDLTTLTITGPIQARFIVDASQSAINFYNDIGLDDISFTGILPCADPTAVVISAITDSGAAITWTENGTATEWEIEYGITGFTPGSGTIVSDNDGTLGETLSGLSSNSSYDVYVRAICSATRTSAWIGPLTFTTACADPSAIVVSNITDSQADVSWTENGTATEWEIEYGLAGFTQGTAGGTIVSDNDGTLGETLGGLNDNTSYDVYVRAICSATNMSAWIGPVSFTTLTCADPSAIVVSNITDSSAAVSWTENGTATEWEIEYGLAGFTQGTAGGTIVLDNDGTLGETLSGLDDATAYDVYVRAICTGTNTSAWVGPQAFTTLVTPCVDPSAIVVSNITDSTADVSWTENGTATEWEIEYGLSGFTQGSGTIVSDNDGTLGETLSGLDDETAYDVYVRAICTSTNMSAWVGPVSFTTLVTPCAAPSAILVSNITDSTADVSWTENGTATEWEIEYGLAGFTPGSGIIVSDNDGTLGETLSGLDDETAYDVYVRAICTSTNMSAWVGPESFTTDTKIKVGENEFIGFAYYPNPMMDVINITGQNQRYELTIFNVIGQQLLTYKMEANTATLDVSHFASGQYLMQVVSESGKTAFYKLIKN